MDEQKDFPRHTGVFLELPLEGRWDGPDGLAKGIHLVMGVAAAEAAVGLAILILIYRNRESTDVDDLNLLKL